MGWEGDITNWLHGAGRPGQREEGTGAVIIHFSSGDFQDAVKNGVTVGVGEVLEGVTPRQAWRLTATVALGPGMPLCLEPAGMGEALWPEQEERQRQGFKQRDLSSYISLSTSGLAFPIRFQSQINPFCPNLEDL